jgi:uncharacterized protein YndB with AHSA1/START domain
MSSNARSGSRILGSLRSADGKGLVRIEDRYDTDIDDLWSAITDPDRLARWHGRVEGDLRPGGEFRLFTADLDSAGRIDVCEPPRRLVVTTRETDESYRVSAEHRPLPGSGTGPRPPAGRKPLACGVEPRSVQWQDFEAWKREPGSPGCATARPKSSP